MSFRIDRVVSGDNLVVLGISGRISGEHVDTFREVLEQEAGALAIDLKNVSLVDREAVKLLGLARRTELDSEIVRPISVNGSRERGRKRRCARRSKVYKEGRTSKMFDA